MKHPIHSLALIASLAIAPFVADCQPATPPPATAVSGGSPQKTFDSAFAVGTNVVYAGIGFAASWTGMGNLSERPAFMAGYERGFVATGPVVFGVGGSVGYQSAIAKFNGTTYNGSTFFISPRGTAHYSPASGFDLYGTVGFSIRRLSVSSTTIAYATGDAATQTDLVGVALVGGRYYFAPKFGVFSELGYDQTYFKAGGVYRF